jgi:large subunit ribosomal protein L13e
MKHNNQLPNEHFRKHWARNVKVWLDQAGRKKSRRLARLKKAVAIAPRPVDGLLRPAVHCPTVRYNMKLRSGRGFTVEELKAAGIRKKEALSIGISVDHRRRNKSVESLQLNAERLKTYKSKLIVFPKKANKPKKGDSAAAEIAAASQLKGKLLPVKNTLKYEAPRAVTAAEKEANAYATVRNIRAELRLVGPRAKRAAEKAAEEKK